MPLLPPLIFHVGNRVKLATREPVHGWSNARVFDEVGLIVDTNGTDDWTVDFPSHRHFHASSDDLVATDDPYDGTTTPEEPTAYTIPFDRMITRPPRESDELIHCYHTSQYRGNRNFLPDKEQDLYLGIELEMESEDNDVYDLARALYPFSRDETIFLMESDDSLDDGLEIVSEPATLAYHKTKFGWQKILEIAGGCEATSHENTTCGLHIHFNVSFFDHTTEAIDLNSAKLLYFLERFWEPLVKFSRRTEHALREYANRYGYIGESSPKGICDEAKRRGGHYYAINLDNHNTIEIRLFRGTLNEETFFACLEFVDFLVRYVKGHTIAYIQRVNWNMVVKTIRPKKYPNLVKYLEGRELLNVPNHS